MDKIVPNRQVNFIINDVELQLDPIQISVYKEGLNYSWKTLRTRASSKIVNGNAVFHLKLNLIFTRSMFLEMHRLVCQMRNTPFVQIQNQFISDSVGLASVAPTFFSVSSLQLIPRADSPYTIDMELDLRYFNHKAFENNLSYKEFLETQPVLKQQKSYTYTFDVFPNDNENQLYGIVEHEIAEGSSQTKTKRRIANASTLLKRNLRGFNSTNSMQLATSSNAFVRYSNYLQIRNLVECFGVSVEELKSILGDEVNARKAKSLCRLEASRKESLINHSRVYGEYTTNFQPSRDQAENNPDLFRDIMISYQDYMRVNFSESENKAVRKHFFEKVKNIKDPNERNEFIAQEKAKIFNPELTPDQVPDNLRTVFNKVKALSANESVNAYTGRRGFNNIFFVNKKVNGVTFSNGSGSVITGFSCGFTNMFSSLPLSGQDYPTHQYLGSSEPIYNINVIASPEFNADPDIGINKGYSEVVKQFESMRSVLQKNAKDFKVVPDAGFFAVDHFFTKLLGSRRAYSVDPISNKLENNFVLRNFNVSTMEGSPGAQSLQFSFCETNNFAEEEMGGVSRLGDDLGILTKVENAVKGIQVKPKASSAPAAATKPAVQPATRTRKTSSKVEYRGFVDWNTKHFSSKGKKAGDFYFAYTDGELRANLDREVDEIAFRFCRDYLDLIQESLPGKTVMVGSSIDFPFTLKRKNSSRHYSGNAADIVVEGMSPLELMAHIYGIKVNGQYVFRGSDRKIGLIGYYKSEAALNRGDKLKNRLLNNFFVHVDGRRKVKRYNLTDDGSLGRLVTEEEHARFDDEIVVTEAISNTYAGLDILGEDDLRGTHNGMSVRTYLKRSSDGVNLEEPDESEEEQEEEEREDEAEISNTNADTPQVKVVSATVNPFHPDYIEGYGGRIEAPSRTQREEFVKFEILREAESRDNNLKMVVIPRPLSHQIDELKESGYEYYYDKDSEVLYIPANATNSRLRETLVDPDDPTGSSPQPGKITKATPKEIEAPKAKPETKNLVKVAKNTPEGKVYVEMLEEFYKLASLMLTEPELYAEDPKGEVERIRKLLNEEKVEPFLFSAFSEFVFGHSGLKEELINLALLNASILGLATTSIAVTTGEGALAGGLWGALVGFVLGTGTVALTGDSLVSGRDGKAVAAIGLTELLNSLFENGINNPSDKISNLKNQLKSESLDKFNTYLGDANDVMNAFLELSNYVIAESPLLKKFSNDVAKVKENTSLGLLLGTYKDLTKTVGGENYILRGALSETLFLGELKRVFEFYFGYPYQEGTVYSEYDFSDLFEVSGNIREASVEIVPLLPKEEYYPPISGVTADSTKERYRIVQKAFGDDAAKASSSFPISKEELKANQDRKLAYLVNLKREILRGLSQVPEVQRAMGLNIEDRLLNLIETNAYPDILLPADPSKPNNNVNLHPGFYFYNKEEEGSYRKGYIPPALRSNVEKIVKRSFDFEKALRTGVFSGSASQLTQMKNGELEYSGYNDLENILIDTLSREENKDKATGDATKTGLTITTTDYGASAERKEELLKEYSGNFKDTFGKVPTKVTGLIESVSKAMEDNGGTPEASEKFKSEEEVVKDALDSTKGMLISKNNIKRAFPTFKLYLIEEDSVESGRISVYDDFYSFGGVKSFSVYEDRKLPTATATIQLQNISGVLDGTKPEVIRDIDLDQDLLPEQEARQQAMVGSIVIRPGINIQLRAGYESNPNELDIVFTGRITEVKNSSNGEVMEVVAQSFGTETISKKLGLQKGDQYRGKTFYNTHSLLGSLCLSEELKHFGRIKKGARFNRAISRSPSLDIETGKSDEWFSFPVTNWLANFFQNYGIYIAVGSVLIGNGRGAFSYLSRVGGAGRFARVANVIQRTRNYVGTAVMPAAIPFNFRALLGGPRLAALSSMASATMVAGRRRIAQFAQAIFITAPSAVYNGIMRAGVARYATNIRSGLKVSVDGVSVSANAFGGRLGNLWRTLRRSAGNTSTISIAEFNQRVLRAVGYEAGVARRLFLDATGVPVIRDATILNAAASAIPGLSGTRIALSGGFSRLLFGGTTVLKNITAVAAAGLVTSILVDGIIGVLGYAGDGLETLWKSRAELWKVKIMLSPQDDNIFPPTVDKYLVERRRGVLNRLLSGPGVTFASAVLNSSFGLIGPMTPSVLSSDERTKILKHTYLKSDNRLNTVLKENHYNLQSTTIWEVFHEMSLRHPGFVYGIRKYGSELESRLFFGRPNQRCFVEPISAQDAALLNKIQPLVENPSEMKFGNLKEILGREITDATFGEAKREVSEFYLKKVEEATEPFRKYHAISSEKDIISNGLRVEGARVVNQVAVSYKSEDSSDERIYQMRGLPYLSEDRVNEKGVNYPNCKGISGACRYGMAELMYGAKEMYSGEILVLGNPKIRTNDICVLADNYLNMHGLIEVAGITHMFSYETGFVTEIKPNAVVFGNDSYMGAISSSTIAMNAHRLLIENNPSIDRLMVGGVPNEKALEEAADEAILRFFSESDSGVYNFIYKNIPGFTDYSNFNPFIGSDKHYQDAKRRIVDKLRESIRNNEPILLEEITNNIGVDLLSSRAESILQKTGITAAVGIASARAILTRDIRSNLVLALLGSGATALGAKGLVSGTESSFKSGFLGRNIFRELLMTQLEFGHLIKILPLVKDGKPIVGGGYEYVSQAQRYKEVFGNFFNPLSDALRGYNAQERELEEQAKYLGVKELDSGFSLKDFLVNIGSSGVEFYSDGLLKGRTLKLYMQANETP